MFSQVHSHRTAMTYDESLQTKFTLCVNSPLVSSMTREPSLDDLKPRQVESPDMAMYTTVPSTWYTCKKSDVSFSPERWEQEKTQELNVRQIHLQNTCTNDQKTWFLLLKISRTCTSKHPVANWRNTPDPSLKRKTKPMCSIFNREFIIRRKCFTFFYSVLPPDRFFIALADLHLKWKLHAGRPGSELAIPINADYLWHMAGR